jgi:hypothetical protein
MKHPLFSTFAALLLCGFVPNALAFESHSTENEWQSATINALGGIGQMSENQSDIFFSDPSLAADQKQTFSMQFGTVSASVSEGAVDAFNTVKSIATQNSSSDSEIARTLSALDSVRSLFGKQIAGGTSAALFTVRVGGFNFIPYINATTEMGAHVPVLPQLTAVGDGYAGLGLGYSYGFGGKKGSKKQGGGYVFSIGANMRPGVRAYGLVKADASELGDLSSGSSSPTSATENTNTTDKFLKYGVSAYSPIDLGAGWRPTPSVRLNMVMRNALLGKSISTIKGTTPEPYPLRINFGGHWHAFAESTSSFVLGTELQDITNLGQESGLWYRWQWAAQYRYRLPFRVRTTFNLNTGLQSGYPSYGAELDLFLFKLEVSRSTRELGYYIGQRPDTRTSFRITSTMSF